MATNAVSFPTAFVDLAVEQGSDGVYDLALDPVRNDAKLTGGLGSAIFISWFSDRRARADEVANPMLRRGWIGDMVSDDPDDRHGSGLWLYEQRRLTPEVAAGVAAEARNALQWMIDDGLITYATVTVTREPAKRRIMINAICGLIEGGVSQHAFVLASATREGLLANTSI